MGDNLDFSLDCSYLACRGRSEVPGSRWNSPDVSSGDDHVSSAGDHMGVGGCSSLLARSLHNQIFQKHGQELIH